MFRERDKERYYRLKQDIFTSIIEVLDISALAAYDISRARDEIRDITTEIISLRSIQITLEEQEEIVTDLCSDFLGLGPLEPLMERDAVLAEAREAKAAGAGRFCMGAAWKGVREGEAKFESVLNIVRDVKQLGMEVCVTLGQLTDEAARQLKDAGVTAYNHNLDTSPDHYRNIVTTHSFEDRLRTIRSVQKAGMAVCCGSILGMGETEDDRLKMLEVLCGFDPSPESVPINCLMPQEGTPLADQKPVDVFELVRLIATTRIALPRARIRLSAGRTVLTREAQALCFYAGANSIFFGDKLLTAPNPEESDDRALLKTLGLAQAA